MFISILATFTGEQICNPEQLRIVLEEQKLIKSSWVF
jgi:hypothetical protein